MNEEREIHTLWKAGRAREAYDQACDLARHRDDLLTLDLIERGEMTLHALVADAGREAVAAGDRDWLDTRLTSGATPPTLDHRDTSEVRSQHGEDRRWLILAHLAAGLAALDRPADAARDERIEAAVAALAESGIGLGLDPGHLGHAVPFGLVRDLATCLAPTSTGPHPAAASGRGRALLVESARETRDLKGRLASIDCELVAGGKGDVYAHPDLIFTMRDADFLGSERQARAFVGGFLPEGEPFDLRWRLRLDGRVQSPRVLYGPSCGAALAVAACRAAALLMPAD